MSFVIMGKVYATDVGDSLAKFVLLVLAEHADNDSHICWPSLSRIQSITHLSRQSVVNKLDYLTSRGFIQRERGHKGQSTRYTILVHQLDQASQPARPEPVSKPNNNSSIQPIPHDWVASEELRAAVDALPNLEEIDHDIEEAQFRSYWQERGGTNADWNAKYKWFIKRHRTKQPDAPSSFNQARSTKARRDSGQSGIWHDVARGVG